MAAGKVSCMGKLCEWCGTGHRRRGGVGERLRLAKVSVRAPDDGSRMLLLG